MSQGWVKIGEATTKISNPEQPNCSTVEVKPAFSVQILGITWEGGYRASRANTSQREIVPLPHWENANEEEEHAPTGYHYDQGSKKPGVYSLKTDASQRKLKVRIKVSNAIGASGPYHLKGELKSTAPSVPALEFIGPCPTATGEDEVLLDLCHFPDSLQHYWGDSSWQVLEKLSGGEYKKVIQVHTTPRLELFVIHDDPADYYTQGVWIEVLRLAFRLAGVAGEKEPSDISAKITRYCHSDHGMTYETKNGEPQFGADYLGREAFNLTGYLKKDGLLGNVVNCYDQAAAVQTFCGALGVKTQWIYQKPYGMIKTTDLVGVGPCNNPFYQEEGAKPIVVDTDPRRGIFFNHAFVQVQVQFICDACAGPHLATENLRQYLENAIDAEETVNKKYFLYYFRLSNFKTTKEFFDHLITQTNTSSPGVTEIE